MLNFIKKMFAKTEEKSLAMHPHNLSIIAKHNSFVPHYEMCETSKSVKEGLDALATNGLLVGDTTPEFASILNQIVDVRVRGMDAQARKAYVKIYVKKSAMEDAIKLKVQIANAIRNTSRVIGWAPFVQVSESSH